MKLRNALLATIDSFKITGKELSKMSGLTEAQISGFRTGKREIDLKNFEKLVNSLPPDEYHHFWCQLAMDQMSKDHLYKLIMMAAAQLKSDVPSKTLVLK